MKKRLKIIGYIAAVLLIAMGGSRVSYAALTYFSENYSAQMEMFDIGVSLVENGKKVSHRDYTQHDDEWDETTGTLLSGMLKGNEQVMPGKIYPEELTVTNSGTIDQYVRVILKRYWVRTDENGVPIEREGLGYEKATELSPELIDLHLIPENGWIVQGDKNDETTILYYNKVLKAGETAPALSDTLKLDGTLWGHAVRSVETDDGGVTHIHVSYPYHGVQFMLEADVEAVQTHNAEDAIRSAWGVDAAVNQDTLTIGEEE